MAYLIIHIPNQPRQRSMLRGRTVIGRAFGSDVWFDDPRLSRTHCVIEQEGGRWVLTDAQSTNGTYVNSKRARRRELDEGDVIEIGRVRIRFQEGTFVEERPVDPIDAASLGPGRIPLESPEVAAATIAGEAIFRRPPPVPQPLVVYPQPLQVPLVPLPFTRPPARPIVMDLEKVPLASRWMAGLINKLRGA